MFDNFNLLLTFIYISCCVYAAFRGHRRFAIVISLILALVFQYVLGFSALAKIIVAVIFVLYYLQPDIRKFLKLPKEEHDEVFSDFKQAASAAKASKSKIDSVFEDFKNFTSKNKTGDAEEKDEQPPSSSGSRKRSRSSSKGSSSSSSRTTSTSRSRSSSSSSNGKKRYSSSKRPSRSGGWKKEQAEKKLQDQRSELEREKQRLKEKEARIERANARAKKELQEQEKKLQQQAQQAQTQLKSVSPRAAPDSRTPEEILGVKAGFTAQELKEARNREVKRWNTTSMVNKPQALVDHAEEEMKKINVAYDELKKRVS